MNSVGLNILSLKYQRFKPPGCKDISLRKFEFAAKAQFLEKVQATGCPIGINSIHVYWNTLYNKQALFTSR